MASGEWIDLDDPAWPELAKPRQTPSVPTAGGKEELRREELRIGFAANAAAQMRGFTSSDIGSPGAAGSVWISLDSWCQHA